MKGFNGLLSGFDKNSTGSALTREHLERASEVMKSGVTLNEGWFWQLVRALVKRLRRGNYVL